MSFSSSPHPALLGLAGLILATLLAAGCMTDSPADTDIPWAAPAGWEGTMPLPSSYMNQYD